MAIILFNHNAAPAFFARIQAVAADQPPRWGKLDAPRMMRHLRFTFELSLGEVEAEDMSNPLTRTVLKKLFFEWFTNWPKGRIKAPVYFTPPADGDLEAERTALYPVIERYLQALADTPERKTLSPLLGPVPLSYWAVIHGVHTHHHLKQFGV
jgi:hypothetical protein